MKRMFVALRAVLHSTLVTRLRRNQVKAEYLMSVESSEGLMQEIGAQALTAAAYQLPEAVLQAVDTITKDAVVQVSPWNVKVVVGTS